MSHADLTCSQVKVMSRKQTGASSALPSLLDPLVPDGEWVRADSGALRRTLVLGQAGPGIGN